MADNHRPKLTLTGSCLCGAVRYAATGAPREFELCHCSRCRKASGGPFIAELVLETDDFRWEQGGSLVRVYEAPVRARPPPHRRAFCTVCGGPVPIVADDLVRIPAGTLDGDPGIRPQRHIFADLKAEWFDITDDLPRFALPN